MSGHIMNTLFSTKLAISVIAIASVFTLSACNNNTPVVENTAPAIVEPSVPVEPSEPTNEAEYNGSEVVVEASADGSFLLPDGEVVSCDEGSTTVVAYPDGSFICDTVIAGLD